MNDAQVWTAIAGLAAALAGMVTIVTTRFLRVVRAEFAAVHDTLERLDRDANARMRDRFGRGHDDL